MELNGAKGDTGEKGRNQVIRCQQEQPVQLEPNELTELTRRDGNNMVLMEQTGATEQTGAAGTNGIGMEQTGGYRPQNQRV